jgi:hypothetical protein
MTKSQIQKEIEKMATLEGSFYHFKDCSVVGYTPANEIDYNHRVDISFFDADSLIIHFYCCEYNIYTSICEYFSDLVIDADGDVLTVKGRWCDLVIEKEDV